MPVACSSTPLRGRVEPFTTSRQGQRLAFWRLTLLMAVLSVNSSNDFRVGDPIVLHNVDGAVTTFLRQRGKVSAVNPVANTVTLVDVDGTTIGTLSGDGADNGGHVELLYSPAQGICEVREWSIDYSREQLDVTPCLARLAQLLAVPWAATKKFRAVMPKSLAL